MATDIFISSAATCVAEISTLPICIVKTRYQNSGLGVREVIAKIYSQGGIRAFYRASAPSLFSQMLSSSTKYTFYRAMEKHNNTHPGSSIVNGICAGVLSSLITHPVDFIKIHWQMGVRTRDVIRTDPKLLYRGYSKSFSKVVVGGAVFYPIYDFVNAHVNSSAAAAFTSACVSTVVMHPLDYLKTRHIFGKKVWDGADPRVYYRGLSLNLARVVPHFTITMMVIEALREQSS